MTPQQTVEAFIDCWNRMDMEAVFGMLSDDVIWHNIPMEPVMGKAAVQAMMDGFPDFESCHWDTHAISANGNKVLTERTDHFTLVGGKKASIRVMGIFEIDANGKIAKWRDYFDIVEFQREFLG